MSEQAALGGTAWSAKSLRDPFNETMEVMDAQDIESPELRLSRWWTLPVVSAAQLLVVLDGTIVNIALPSAQSALGMSDGSRPWVVTAYALAFGGLLLIGGRVGSAWGHRRAFGIGLAGFAVASALGGAAGNQETLFAARALQGAFAAVLAPAGLSLLTMTFTGPLVLPRTGRRSGA